MRGERLVTLRQVLAGLDYIWRRASRKHIGFSRAESGREDLIVNNKRCFSYWNSTVVWRNTTGITPGTDLSHPYSGSSSGRSPCCSKVTAPPALDLLPKVHVRIGCSQHSELGERRGLSGYSGSVHVLMVRQVAIRTSFKTLATLHISLLTTESKLKAPKRGKKVGSTIRLWSRGGGRVCILFRQAVLLRRLFIIMTLEEGCYGYWIAYIELRCPIQGLEGGVFARSGLYYRGQRHCISCLPSLCVFLWFTLSHSPRISSVSMLVPLVSVHLFRTTLFFSDISASFSLLTSLRASSFLPLSEATPSPLPLDLSIVPLIHVRRCFFPAHSQ